MGLLVDTSVWSLAYRRDTPPGCLEVTALRDALTGGGDVLTTGLILLELLQGIVPAKSQAVIQTSFAALEFIVPTTHDYIAAAELSNTCRRVGVRLETVDALITQLAIAHDLILLTTDHDFEHAARHIPLRLWGAP